MHSTIFFLSRKEFFALQHCKCSFRFPDLSQRKRGKRGKEKDVEGRGREKRKTHDTQSVGQTLPNGSLSISVRTEGGRGRQKGRREKRGRRREKKQDNESKEGGGSNSK